MTRSRETALEKTTKVREEMSKKQAATNTPRKPKPTPFSRARWERNITKSQAKPIGELGVPASNVRRIIRSRVNEACKDVDSDKMLTISTEAMNKLTDLFLEFFIEHGSELALIATNNCNKNPTGSDRTTIKTSYMRRRGLLAAPNQTPFEQQAAQLSDRACRNLASHSKEVADYLFDNNLIDAVEHEKALTKVKQAAKNRTNSASRARRARRASKRAEASADPSESKEDGGNSGTESE